MPIILKIMPIIRPTLLERGGGRDMCSWNTSSYIHGVKYHEVKNTVVKYNVSLLIRQDLVHSISAQGKQPTR